LRRFGECAHNHGAAATRGTTGHGFRFVTVHFPEYPCPTPAPFPCRSAVALEGKFNERLYHVTEGHAHALLNFAYVHAATAAGPVLADRILSAAITAVDAMREAALYAPRKLP
jgi:hypothetical protein